MHQRQRQLSAELCGFICHQVTIVYTVEVDETGIEGAQKSAVMRQLNYLPSDEMRLLRVDNRQFEEVPSHGPFPRYAILSHTWLQPSTEEVTYQDLSQERQDHAAAKAGWDKVQKTFERASRDGIPFVWIDTCCINKLDPTELTEAINSMYAWYSASSVCYAYLSDVDVPRDQAADLVSQLISQLGKSQWFTRGWTLQELVAPGMVEFYDRRWRPVTTRAVAAPEISAITRIPLDLLGSPEAISQYSIANRMSWAAGRQTTRVEDRAYSLLGIFNIVMPLHYGEGAEHAFTRLQQEIIKQDADQSILAWEWPSSRLEDVLAHAHQRQAPFLAPSPDCFGTRSHVTPARRRQNVTYSISNLGLEMDAYLMLYKKKPVENKEPDAVFGSMLRHRPKTGRARPLWEHDSGFIGAIINCSSLHDTSMVYMLPVNWIADDVYRLRTPMDCLEMDWFDLQRQMEPLNPNRQWQKITILRSPRSYGHLLPEGLEHYDACAKVRVSMARCPELEMQPWAFWPEQSWNRNTLVFLSPWTAPKGAITFRCIERHGDGKAKAFVTVAFDPTLGTITNVYTTPEAPPFETSRSMDPVSNVTEMIAHLDRTASTDDDDDVRFCVSAEQVETPCDEFMLVKVMPESRHLRAAVASTTEP
ncbi:hypothetical protein PRZ48_014264 [Zasmidium cellare]|uniref:Heterokaryon incompatibility domain-containing protein n=1 Tax=Zasmidium cellare TaxID=395010 RepID=A0ABR0E171_ZASCE|nr:hypothetical protein PRZ48_014264 [Zasmidium cellare]